MLNTILDKVVGRIRKYQFKRVAVKVRKSKPLSQLTVSKAKIVIVSQIYHDAVDMSLVALKSFILELGMQVQVDLVDDGSLKPEDYSLLQEHIPNVRIVGFSEIDIQECPKGGTWERLNHILSLTSEHYVIQVDTDTLTLGSLEEVIQCINENLAFTISGSEITKPFPVDSLKELKPGEIAHVQIMTEANLKHLKQIPLTHYCRGCSAFTGFPMGSNLKDKLSTLSNEMSGLISKEKWSEWGSEQVSSNIMISIHPTPKILPWPKYQNYGFPKINNLIKQDVSLIHFIGTFRYSNGTYKKYVQEFLKNLNLE